MVETWGLGLLSLVGKRLVKTLKVMLVGRVKLSLLGLGVPPVMKKLLGCALSTSGSVILKVESIVLSELGMRIISMVLGV
jgi:hypothetical protein